MTTQNNSMKVWEQIVATTRKRLVDAGYPIPVKPKTPVTELVIPEDIEALNPVRLANLLLRLHGWYAYATAQLAFFRAELSAFNEFYDVTLGQKMAGISAASESRQVKEVLKALALQQEPLNHMFTKRVELEQRTKLVEGLVQSLDIQTRALTNEQIRRHAAQKVSERGDF